MNAIHLHRVARWFHQRNVRVASRLFERLIFLLYNSSIPASVEIGECSRFAYGGMGVVLHHDCRIGRDVLISQQVTLGGRAPRDGVPEVGDGCFIGPGARILGPIRIGEGSIIGANAVVLDDVPPRSVAAGVPARIIRSDISTRDYYVPPSEFLGETLPAATTSSRPKERRA